MKWLQALAKAALAGGVIATAPIAASMASDAFTSGELRVLLSTFIAGALGGLSGLFINTPGNAAKTSPNTQE